MKTIEDQTLDAMLAPPDSEPIMPEHRAWMNAQIRETLAKKKSKEATYNPLEQVRKELGL